MTYEEGIVEGLNRANLILYDMSKNWQEGESSAGSDYAEALSYARYLISSEIKGWEKQ